MITNEKRIIYDSQKYRRTFLRMRSAVFAIFRDWRKLMCLLASIMFFWVIWDNRDTWFQTGNWFDYVCVSAYILTFFGIFWTTFFAVFGYALQDNYHRKAFVRIGHINSAGETPILLSVKTINGVTIFVYESNGIPLGLWKERIEELQNVLNFSISSIKTGKNSKTIIMTGTKGLYDYNREVYWHPLMQTYDDTVRLGEFMGEPVFLNFNQIPHVLIGGATGSGKSFLLKHVLIQCINKKYKITIADFKGGCDFSQSWREYCDFVCDMNDTFECLSQIWNELKRRQEVFAQVECPNINAYNAKYADEALERIIFACDELAELLDVSGLEKEEKEVLRKIEKYLSSIARLGRAFGIHLILATQRPDADVVNGQIKNNITYRICGRADSILSKIILDNTEASENIPKDAEGLFLNQDGKMFKGYVYDEDSDIYV